MTLELCNLYELVRGLIARGMLKYFIIFLYYKTEIKFCQTNMTRYIILIKQTIFFYLLKCNVQIYWYYIILIFAYLKMHLIEYIVFVYILYVESIL